jgi:hypothetical protein
MGIAEEEHAMTVDVYRFEFAADVPLSEAEMTLQLATIALEGLVGQARVRLDVTYHLDQPRRTIIVDGTTHVGAALVRVFTGLALREFGEDAFCVRRTHVACGREGRAA